MFNPLKKLAAILGLVGISQDPSAPTFQNVSRRSKLFTTTPMHMRKAERRRRNKNARLARRLNRS